MKAISILVNYETKEVACTFSKPGRILYDSYIEKGFKLENTVYGFDLTGAKKPQKIEENDN